MSSRRNRRFTPSVLAACFCGGGSRQKSEDAIGIHLGDRLSSAIQSGDLEAVERALGKIRSPHTYTITIRRRHTCSNLQPHQQRGDSFVYFSQECSPVLWAVDCKQWCVLPLLAQAGLDPNRPQMCRRWTSLCSPSTNKPTISPYKKLWTRGKYTYQSSLDYFFASVYEALGSEDLATTVTTQLALCYQQLPLVLTSGVDVHRLDSVIVFNLLAASFNRYLSDFTNIGAHFPDIPDTLEGPLELGILRSLIQHGFSQFECMEFLSPCYNWFGILLCLLCHPLIDSCRTHQLPPIIQQTALLMINLLAMRCSFPTPNEFEDNLENLHIRKLYTKRYTDKRLEFNSRLQMLRKQCLFLKAEPLSLKMIARNQLRRQIGGVNFRSKVAGLPLPQSLTRFIQFIEIDHLKACSFPRQLVDLASGVNIYFKALSSSSSEESDSTV